MKKKLTIATLKGRVPISSRADLEAALFPFRKQYDADPERYLEDVQALILRMQGVKASKIRVHPLVKHKLGSARAYRQRLQRLQAQLKQPLSQDRINSFIEANWDELTIIPNPHDLPGLCAWYPSAAVELMKRVGVLHHNSTEIFDAKWFKKRRQRLKLRPAPRYRIKLGKSPCHLVVLG